MLLVSTRDCGSRGGSSTLPVPNMRYNYWFIAFAFMLAIGVYVYTFMPDAVVFAALPALFFIYKAEALSKKPAEPKEPTN